MNQNNTSYVAAFQTWNGGMSRMVTGEENVRKFIEASRDSFAKLHLFIDEETANASHEKEWNDMINRPPSIEYRDYSELKELGIDKVVEGGINPFGFRERMVVCEDGSVWDYIPEDRIYEKRN